MHGDGVADIDIEMGEMESFLDPTITSFQASAIIAVCAAVLIGNAFVCALNCFKSHNSYCLYLRFVMASAAVNMISAIICMPLMAACLIQGEWKFGYLLCKMTGAIVFGSIILTMIFCILASINKLSLYIISNCRWNRGNIFYHKDFIINSVVIFFIAISLSCLFFLIDRVKILKEPQRTLCYYANSPNVTKYRMFYIVYSTFLTFADLILVMPIQAGYLLDK